MLGTTSDKIDFDKETPKYCDFCGKKLEQTKVFIQGITKFFPKYEDCDCPQFKEHQRKEKEIKLEEKRKQKEALRKQKEQEEETQRISTINKLFDDSGMSKRALASKFENYQPNFYNQKAIEIALKYVENFESLPKKNGLFLAGPCGVGKSHLAYAIANALIEQGKSVICMTMIELLMKIKSSYNGFIQMEPQILSLYKNCSLLIIDDLGKEKTSEWALEKMYAIIDSRYTNLMPIIITTNYTVPELIQKLKVGDDIMTATAIVDRLLETCQYIPFEGMSQRKQ